MNEFVLSSNQTIIIFGIALMLFLTLVAFWFRETYPDAKGMPFLMLGNLSMLAYFVLLIISEEFGDRLVFILGNVFEVLSITLWVLAIQNMISYKVGFKRIVFANIVSIIGLAGMYHHELSVNIIRSIVSIIMAYIILSTLLRSNRMVNVKIYKSYRFLRYSLFYFLVYKLVMSLYRYRLAFDVFDMTDGDYTIGISLVLSSLFAVLINFVMAFLNQDMLRMQVEELSLQDYLTKIPNRQYLMNRLKDMYELHKREKAKFAVALFDVDDFKVINDTFGHAVGDEVLIKFAQFLKKSIRRIDLLSRYGGEEFVVVIYVDNVNEAQLVFDRMLKDIKYIRLSEKGIDLKFSGGVVMVDENCRANTLSEIINIADERLYRAKRNGKNQILYED